MSNENSSMPRKIMFIEDQTVGLQEHKSFLERNNMQVLTAPDLSSALYLFKNNSVDVALIALEFPDVSGLAVLQKLRAVDSLTKRFGGAVLMSNSKERLKTDTTSCSELGGVEVISKPFKTIQLLPFLMRAYSRRNIDLKVNEFKTQVVDYLRKNGDFDKAIAQTKQKIAEFGDKGPGLLLGLYEEGNKNEEALMLTNALMTKPENKENIQLVNTKGRLLMRLGRFGEAKVAMEHADQLAPKNIERLNNMAAMYLQLNDPQKSVEKMREIVQLNPETPELKFDMFSKLQEKGFAKEAMDFCKDTTEPMEVVRFYNNKGVLKAKELDSEGAIKEYQDSLIFYPGFAENYRIYFNMALALLKTERPQKRQEAITALQKSLELNPKYDKAIEVLQKLTPGNAAVKKAS